MKQTVTRWALGMQQIGPCSESYSSCRIGSATTAIKHCYGPVRAIVFQSHPRMYFAQIHVTGTQSTATKHPANCAFYKKTLVDIKVLCCEAHLLPWSMVRAKHPWQNEWPHGVVTGLCSSLQHRMQSNSSSLRSTFRRCAELGCILLAFASSSCMYSGNAFHHSATSSPCCEAVCCMESDRRYERVCKQARPRRPNSTAKSATQPHESGRTCARSHSASMDSASKSACSALAYSSRISNASARHRCAW